MARTNFRLKKKRVEGSGGTQLKDCCADKLKSSLEKAKFEESPAFVSKCGPQ